MLVSVEYKIPYWFPYSLHLLPVLPHHVLCSSLHPPAKLLCSLPFYSLLHWVQIHTERSGRTFKTKNYQVQSGKAQKWKWSWLLQKLSQWSVSWSEKGHNSRWVKYSGCISIFLNPLLPSLPHFSKWQFYSSHFSGWKTNSQPLYFSFSYTP